VHSEGLIRPSNLWCKLTTHQSRLWTLIYWFVSVKYSDLENFNRLACSSNLNFNNHYVTAKQIKFNCYSFQQTRDAKFNIHYYILKETLTRRALDGAHVPPTKVFPRLAVNKTILKPRLAAATGAQYLYVVFFRRKIPRCSAYNIRESNPVPAYGL